MMHTKRYLGAAAAATVAVSGLLLPTGAAFGAAGPCPGTDDTTNHIHKLSGDCQLAQTWFVASGWTIRGGGHTITVAPGFTGPVIASEAGTSGVAPPSMTVENVTIDATGSSGHVVAVLFDGAAGAVHGVTISGVSTGTVGDNGYGVEADNSVGADFGATGLVKVDRNTTISGYQRAAVYAHGDLKLSVLRAVIESPAAISGQAVAGVLVTDGAHGSVKENHIALSDTEPASPSAFGAGVEIAKDNTALPRRVEVKRNVFTGGNADFGISVTNVSQLAKMTAATSCNLFRRQDTSASDLFGVGVAQWQDSAKTNVQVSNSTFKGNWHQATGTVSGTNVTAGPDNTLGASTSTCPPGAPTHVRAVGGNHRIKVTWRAAVAPDYAPLTEYRVKAKRKGHPAISKTVGPNATSAVLKGLKNNRSYVVTVQARSNGGKASASDRVRTHR